MKATPLISFALFATLFACGAEADLSDYELDDYEPGERELAEHEQALIETTVASSNPMLPLDPEIMIAEIKPLCRRGEVARYVSQPIQAVAPSASVMCEFFLNGPPVLCSTLPMSDQLALIGPSLWSADGFRMNVGDFQAFVDVPIPRGKRSLYVQELTDLGIRYELRYDLGGQAKVLSAGFATPGYMVVVDDAGHLEQEIPISAFPSGSTNRRVRIVNSDRYYGRFLSRIYVRGWECVADEPYNP